MTFKWNENVTLKFLEEYKKHECLWNQNFTQYYNCCAKKEALRTIINKLNISNLTQTDCEQQIETITKKYEQEQSKTLHGLCSGKPYEPKLPWYPLMQDMLTKTFSNERNDNLKVTICTNSIPDKKKKSQISKKKKTKSKILSPATEIITYDSCGHKIVRKPAPRPTPSGKTKRPTKKLKQKDMTEKYINYVQCPGFGTSNNNSFRRPDEERETESSGDQNSPPLESICIREIKKRRDIPRINTLDTKSIECSSCCQNSENNHYAAKDNYSPSNNMIHYPSYFSKPNNSNLNYNDFRYKDSNNQHQFRTRFVPCSNSLKPPDQLFSTCQSRNSYSYSKNLDNYSASERNFCSNNFDKNAELCHGQELPEHDTNLKKPSSCVRSMDISMKPNKGLSFIPEVNDKNLCPTSGDQGVVQFIPRVATKFENGVFEVYSELKISMQCCEKGQDNKKVYQKSSQETQTFLEKKQQSVCTNSTTYDTKETQSEGTKTLCKQTEMDVKDPKKEIPNTVCVSCDQTNEMKDNLSDYILLMPGGKCVRLAKTNCSKENFVPCQGVSESRFDDEAFSVCTETSCMTQESRFIDCDTMTTPQLIECVEEMLNINSNSREIQVEEILDSVSLSRTENREIEEKESQCDACKSSEGVDEDFRFCFKKLFNKEISSSDCFPCLQEKIDKTGDLTKTFLYVLKCALDLDGKAENNTKGSRFKSKSRTEVIKKICKCVKKLSEVKVVKKSESKNLVPKNSQIEENRTDQETKISGSVNETSKNFGVSKQTETENEPSISRSMNTISKSVGSTKHVSTEKEPAISRSVNAISKNVGISKQVATEERPFISRSMNTFIEENPLEIIQTHFENEETNTDFSTLQKEAGTSPMKNKSQDASTQIKARLSEKHISKGKTTGIPKRDPILVRVVSASDRQRMKAQSSQSSMSENDEFRKNGCKRVCFNEKKEYEIPKRDFKCGKDCKELIKDWAKIRLADKSNYRQKKKILEKKLTEAPKTRSAANRKKKMAKGSPKGEPMEIENPTKSELNSEESFWWLKFVPQPNTWTNVNIFRFLRLYKTYPVLWDPKNPKYSKPSERSRAYREITKKLNLQGVHEKEYMKLVESLKKIYIEEKQKREEAKSCIQIYKPPPVWFQVLNDIVESVMNNEREEEKSSSGINIKNEINKEKMKELIKCIKTHTDNIWTPNYFKTEVWKLFLPKAKSYVTQKENIKKDSKGDSEILANKYIDSNNQSCEALKPLKPNYCPDYKNNVCDCYSLHSIQSIKNYCPDFANILCDCSSHSESIQSEKKYCPELKNVLCNCSSDEKTYCPELKNIVCNCSSNSIQKIKKYCPEFKNIICDCLSQSSQDAKKYCPEFKNILCDCSSQSIESVKEYCPEFKSVLCNCSSDTKYCPEYKDVVCDCSSKTSSDSKITEYFDSRMPTHKVATPFTFVMPTLNKAKYDKPYAVDLDRYCYYKDWSNYYKCKICHSKEQYQESRQLEKDFDFTFSNQKPPRPHKNNTVFESEINIFSDMNRQYPLQLFDCMEQENSNSLLIK